MRSLGHVALGHSTEGFFSRMKVGRTISTLELLLRLNKILSVKGPVQRCSLGTLRMAATSSAERWCLQREGQCVRFFVF